MRFREYDQRGIAGARGNRIECAFQIMARAIVLARQLGEFDLHGFSLSSHVAEQAQKCWPDHWLCGQYAHQRALRGITQL
jgi:hypothetical protein